MFRIKIGAPGRRRTLAGSGGRAADVFLSARRLNGIWLSVPSIRMAWSPRLYLGRIFPKWQPHPRLEGMAEMTSQCSEVRRIGSFLSDDVLGQSR